MSENAELALAAYQAGRSRLEAGDLEGAIALLQESVAANPHFKTLELLGEALLRAGRPLMAIVPLAAATTLNDQVRAPSLLAEALQATGDVVDAHRMALLALKRDPTNKKARSVHDATREAYNKWGR